MHNDLHISSKLLYYQLLTIDHDRRVPVDKHGGVKILPHPFDPVNIFAEILHACRGAIDMKHIKKDFSLKTWVQSPGVVLEGGAKANNQLFRNMVMLHIKLKGTMHDAINFFIGKRSDSI